jgi:hypothetical protein
MKSTDLGWPVASIVLAALAVACAGYRTYNLGPRSNWPG